MEKTYIFGHRKPDTDSISASIALSYLKNKLGFNTEAVAISDINNESTFALDYFGIDKPKFLNDVKIKLKDVNYVKDYFINENFSIFKGYQMMQKENLSKIPVVDVDNNFNGILSMKSIAKDQLEGNYDKLDTNFDDIKDVLNATSVLKFDNNIKGNLVIASLKSTTFMENVNLDENDILIVGDRHSIIEYAVNSKVKLIILTGDSQIKEKHIEIAYKNKVNIIKTSLLTLKVSKIISLSNRISTISSKFDYKTVDILDNVSDFIALANKTKHSYYPVIDKQNKCYGIIRLSDLNEINKKKVILVDHNTISQSIEGIEEAEILEVIDHHNIGNIATTMPISFRNMPVGSTNTIIFQIFNENNINIPSNIAGLMVSGIISDTLILKSPTTTKLDIDAVEKLSKIAGIDYKEYGFKLIKAGSTLKDKSVDEIIHQDYKIYPLFNSKIGIGQISTTVPEEILENKEDFIKTIESISIHNEQVLTALFITDILNNGSYVLFNNSAKELLEKSFNLKEIKQGTFLPGVVSRKLQVIPYILENKID